MKSSDATVLIQGESGTGKELAANAIHLNGSRAEKPFVSVNCSALSESLLESELFGHVKGAFTGAIRDRLGRVEQADGGTLFLDEIGEISPLIQLKLLRVLQERQVEPLGGVKAIPVDVRVVAATNRDLAQLVRSGKFREDLYYRIRVVYLKLPDLKQRREDIPLLVDKLIARFNRLQDRDIAGVSDRVIARLMEHDYPGNVRELENIIEQAFVLCQGGIIECEHLPLELRPPMAAEQETAQSATLKDMERVHIHKVIMRYNGNRKEAAGALGINVSTLYRKIQEIGIDCPDTDGRGKRRSS